MIFFSLHVELDNLGPCPNTLLPFLIICPIEGTLDFSLTVQVKVGLLCPYSRKTSVISKEVDTNLSKDASKESCIPQRTAGKFGLERLHCLGIADNLAELWLRLQLRGAGGMREPGCGAHVMAETH